MTPDQFDKDRDLTAGLHAEEERAAEPEDGNTEVLEEQVDKILVDAHELRDLEAQLIASQSQAEEYLDGWQRARADFANYKKRVERDRAAFHQTASGSIIKRYLEIADDLELALNNPPQDEEGAVWADGIELIYQKLVTIMESEGVKAMDTKGTTFDPNLHEAISLEDSDDHESGEIIEEMRKGYLMGDRVLRPATVRVAR